MQGYTYFCSKTDCGYLLESPRRGASNVYQQSMFRAKILQFFFSMKFSIFASEKNLCILHGQVFVMAQSKLPTLSILSLTCSELISILCIATTSKWNFSSISHTLTSLCFLELYMVGLGRGVGRIFSRNKIM